ncbi:glycosyltransferase [candidate division WWE3 bacterium]|nr:glycosyltransferase [candidate division WWE3 bacterium]
MEKAKPLNYPKITVVTCSYNRAGFIKKALDSIESQTYKNIQHIINDSFSTDGTVEIIKDYIKRNKHKYEIIFFQTKPQGIAKALNDTLPYATGDLIHFLHSDDYYINDSSLGRVAQYFREDPTLEWLTGNCVIEKNGKIYRLKLPKIIRINPKKYVNACAGLSHENTFVKTKLVKESEGFQEDKTITVEFRLWLRLIKTTKLMPVDEDFAVLISHDGSASSASIFSFLKGLVQAIDVFKKEGIIPVIGSVNDIEIYQQIEKLKAKVISLNTLLKKQ